MGHLPELVLPEGWEATTASSFPAMEGPEWDFLAATPVKPVRRVLELPETKSGQMSDEEVRVFWGKVLAIVYANDVSHFGSGSC